MSLTARVSAFFLAALAVTLAGFSASFYLLARAYLSRQVDERLASALETLSAAAEVEDNGVDWEPDEHRLTLGGDADPEAMRWEVRDEAGRSVDRSRNLGAGALGDDGERRLASRRLSAAEKPAASLPPERHAALVLTAGASLQPMEDTLRLLALTLAGLSAGLWLAAAVVGWLVCRWALAPVTRMAAVARSMDATKPGASLPAPGTRDEVDDLARAFNGLLARLGEAFERQRRFTGDASHQLRTPLTAMLGQTEVALRRDRPAEEYRRVLSQVHGQAEHLHRIVEALLFLARADAEAPLPGVEAVDLAPWLPAHVAHRADHARAADLRLEKSAGPLWVRAQPVLLGILVDNLVDNALKYSEAGTPVTLSARRDGDAVALSVEDAGCGIAADELPHIFEPFYRSPEARRLGRGGTGLGLAVARRVAVVFGGGLTAESQPGRGSRFTLRLPAAAVPAADADSAAERRPVAEPPLAATQPLPLDPGRPPGDP
jgi:heavy metal sensor kinase